MFKNLIGLRRSRSSKVLLSLLLIGYLSGYQPVLAIPPIRQSIAQASVSQQTIQIDSQSFSEKPQLPHPGYLSTPFSSWHPGVDIATGLGMPVRPILKGHVVEVTYGFWGLGHDVVVEHERGYRSTYGHMGRIFVKVGDSVNESTILGEVGLTGNTSGPHTHLEVQKDFQYIDPRLILPKIPSWEEYVGVTSNPSLGTGNR